MAADADATGWIATIAALFGAGGGGTALVKQIRAQAQTEQRVSALEKDVTGLRAKDDKHDDQFMKIERTLGGLDEKTETILEILRERK